ncbi:CocE/NonD family hydrolase [Streptosporangium sp. NPDC002524]|uniref:CocE/NonD family hydrolase n=1 Tax=Streptosporangium sp. NPDC002524 TaxID=3154537 RepID=UPI00332CAC33
MLKLNRSPLSIVAEHDTPMPVRDGTILRGDVYRPASEGPFPALLVRTPYGAGSFLMAPRTPALEAGFAVVLQHCRGRGSSDGEFRPWLDEGDDGYDTVGWITSQPWSNGEVVAFGMSYLAGCALQAAAKRPPGLKAVVASMTPHDFYDGLNYHGGAFALGSALNWGLLQAMLGLMHGMEAGEDVGAGFGALLPVLGDQTAAVRTLPLRDIPAGPWWNDWISHLTRDAYWEGLAETLRHDRIEVPVMHVGGWFDLFLAGTLENHRRLGGPLVIGPWSHGSGATGTGRLDFGFSASAQAAMLPQRQMDFLRGEDTGPAVKIFVMGDNVWRDEEEWPLSRAVDTRYHLHPGGLLSTEPPSDAAPLSDAVPLSDAEPSSDSGPLPGATPPSGAELLPNATPPSGAELLPNATPPSGATPSTFTFDPRDPVPTTGGPLLLPDVTNVGPQDQRDVELRPDVLCFTTEALASDVEVTGPLSVTLHAETSAVSTDWTAKLVDVHPDGRAMSVTDGIVRTSVASGVHEIDLVATSQVFKTGHRIRVEISSSNFPRFDRNPGNGRTSADSTEADLVLQHQTVFPDSYITLPIVPR